MAKEVVTPDPIPVRSGENISDSYCATYLDYSEDSFSNVSKELISYLQDKYDNSGLGGSTQSFMACNTTEDQVRSEILSAGIHNISSSTLYRYAILIQCGNDVMISVIMY